MSSVAAAVMVGLIISRMPLNICFGRCAARDRARKRTTTNSSKEVTQANRAPETTPGRMSGRITLKNTVCGGAPRPGAGASQGMIEPRERRRYGDDDERRCQGGVCQDQARERIRKSDRV